MPSRSLKINIENWLPPMATIWLFVVLNSYIVWNALAPVVRILPALVIIGGTFLISKKLRFTKSLCTLSLFIIIYFFWVTALLSFSFASFVRRVLEIVPMLCIIFWPKVLILRTYNIIRKIIIFFAIGSAIITVLILLGFGERIPHLTLPPREPLHERIGMVYYLYGFFIADHYPISGVAGRACGMLQEPGHFAILLGFIYIIERFSNRKINFWIVLCGVLTFSSAFVLMMLFTEIYQLFVWKKLRKLLLILPVIAVGLIAVYSFLPSEIKEQVEYLAYGRNLENVVDAYNETSSLTGALDERANDDSIAQYEKLNTKQYLFGGGKIGKDGMLSDYRGMILMIGVFGVVLSTLLYILVLKGTPLKVIIALGFAYFLVIIHRSWMLLSPYIFFLAFMAVFFYKVYNPKRVSKFRTVREKNIKTMVNPSVV